jgi:hypothetical protein
VAAAVLLAFGLGGAAAWSQRKPDLLVGATPANGVQRMANADLQLWLADSLGTEEAYQAVQRNFPGDAFQVRQAERGLAKLYLQELRLEEALLLFDRLAAVDQVDVEDRAFGLAGQIVTHSLGNRTSEAAARLDDLFPIVDKLNDQEMTNLLRRAVGNLRQTQAAAREAQWQGWLTEQFGEESG